MRSSLNRQRRWIVAALVASASLPVAAQTVETKPTDSAPAINLGGTPSVDLITLRATSPSSPLRYGNVIVGSERVQLDGRILSSSTDYAMDYESGVVYLKVPQKAGSVLTVTYRYSDKADPQAANRTKGLTGFKYSLVPGGLNLVMGLGSTERTQDGRVLTGDAFGFNNSLKFGGGGGLNGLYVYANRRQSETAGGLQMNAAGGGNASDEQGASQLIVQKFNYALGGGTITADYQDVGKNFASFNAAADAGATADQIGRLRSEKGLTRMGFSANGVNVGALGIRSGMRSISDGKGKLSWSNYGATVGGFSFDAKSQTVDASFGRFKDIAEGDRDQLERERGMKRDNLAASLTQKIGKLNYSVDRIEDMASGQGVSRTQIDFDSAKFKFSNGSQEVDRGFTRIPSLMGDEQGRFGLEVGLKRQWSSLQASIAPGATLDFRSSGLTSGKANFSANDASVRAKTWSLEHSSRTVDKDFSGFRGMKPEEQDANTAAIAKMYGAGAQARPEDRYGFSIGQGISRDYTSFQANPFKNWDLSFTDLQLRGRVDSGSVQTATLKKGDTQVTFRKQNFGGQFSDFANLMNFERLALGNIAGLDRTDFGFTTAIGRGKQFSANQTYVQMGAAGFKRQQFAYSDKKIDLKLNSRDVDSGLAALNQMNDPEKDLLASLQGYKQRDASVKWKILPNFNIDASMWDAVNDATNVSNRIQNLNLDWQLNGKTKLGYQRYEQKQQDTSSVQFAQIVQRFNFVKDFGKLGAVQFTDEQINFGGQLASAPDSHKQYLAYQTRLDTRTDLKSEQTRVTYSNGTDEKVNSNTVSTAVTKNVGVSVSEVAVDRDGETRDEKHRNYGFWLDLGKGLRISYGYIRQMIGEETGQTSSSLTIGQNSGRIDADKINQNQASQVGGLMVGGGYGSNSWDQDGRTQGFSNFTFATAKPLSMGALKDVKFNFSMDNASDYTNWLRENRLMSFGGRLGSNLVGYEYRSQLANGGERGIDRSFRFETSQSDRAWLRASIFYKMRSLPGNQQTAIRNYNITAKPAKDVELVHRLSTNPEEARADLILGSLPKPERMAEWGLNWKQNKNVTLGGSWVERISDQTNARSRTAFVNVTLNEGSGSPIRLSYGLEEATGNQARTTNQRYSLAFDQRSGANQLMSLYLGNVSYEGYVQGGQGWANLTVRLNYQLRF